MGATLAKHLAQTIPFLPFGTRRRQELTQQEVLPTLIQNVPVELHHYRVSSSSASTI
jgi:nicotinic acid phosphoribosyltransferase